MIGQEQQFDSEQLNAGKRLTLLVASTAELWDLAYVFPTAVIMMTMTMTMMAMMITLASTLKFVKRLHMLHRLKSTQPYNTDKADILIFPMKKLSL